MPTAIGNGGTSVGVQILRFNLESCFYKKNKYNQFCKLEILNSNKSILATFWFSLVNILPF